MRWAKRKDGQSGFPAIPPKLKAFYMTIAAATVVGALANVLNVSPIKALVWAAALNAVVAASVMVLIMSLGTSVKVMGKFRIGRAWSALDWLATGLMAVASIAFLVSCSPARSSPHENEHFPGDPVQQMDSTHAGSSDRAADALFVIAMVRLACSEA